MRLTVVLLLVACGAKDSAPPPPAKITDGIQITYSVDLEAAVDETATEITHTLRAELARAAIAAEVRSAVVPLGGFSVTVADAARRADVEAIIESRLGSTVQARTCEAERAPSAICMRITGEHADWSRKTALDQTVSVIRARLASSSIRATVAANGTRVVVDLASASDDELSRSRDVIARAGRLQLVATDPSSPFMRGIFEQAKADERAQERRWLDARIEAHTDESRIRDVLTIDVHLRSVDRESLRRYLDELARMDPRFVVPADRRLAFGRVDGGWRTHYLVRDGVSGRAIKTAGVQGEHIVLALDTTGAAALAALATEHGQIAAVIDGAVSRCTFAAPAQVTIATHGSGTEALALATVLRSPLPAPILEETLYELRGGKVILPAP